MAKRRKNEEAAFEHDVVTRAEADGWEARKVKYLCRRGALDYLFYKHKRVVFMEFKKPSGGGVLSGQQKKEIRLMKERGLEAYVVESMDHAREILGF